LPELFGQSGASASFQLYTDGALKQTLSALNTVRLGTSAGLVNAALNKLPGLTPGSLFTVDGE
jgi:hypothetical protein